jgi:acetoin utilization deacetylase AcuC-like enzyme
VLPLLESYGPEMILISAGFDAGKFDFAAFMFLCKKYIYFISLLTADGDAVGECKVTPKGYATLLDMVRYLIY